MSNLLPLQTAASRLALALALALPLAPAAFAQNSAATTQQVYHAGQYDAFGAQNDRSIAAAQSVNSAPVTAAQPANPAVASTVPMAAAPRDIVGDHGPQDALANQIYQPGSRPAGW